MDRENSKKNTETYEADKLFEGLKKFVETETVFGKPYHVGKITLIPINAIRLGVGLAEKSNQALSLKKDLTHDEGGQAGKMHKSLAGGGGVSIQPQAFIVIQNDQVSIHNLATGTIENVLDRLPLILDKIKSLSSDLFPSKTKEKPTGKNTP